MFQFLQLTPEKLVPLAGILYILPIFLFSDLMGQLSDFYPKSRIIQMIKVFELIVIALVICGFYFKLHFLIFACLFLLGFHSAVFGPLKYSYTSEIVDSKDLLKANSLIETGTFLSLVIGTLAGGYLILKEDLVFLFFGLLALSSILSVYSSLQIKKSEFLPTENKISLKPFSGFFKIYKKYKSTDFVFFELFSYAWFWLFAGAILGILPTFTKKFLSADAFSVSLVISLFSIGIAIGAILVDKVFKGKVDLGVISFASFGMSFGLLFFCFFITWVPFISSETNLSVLELSRHISFWGYQLLLLFISITCSLFIIPLFTDLQNRTQASDKTLMFSVSNILNSLFMIIGLSFSLFMQSLNLSFASILLTVSVLNLVVAFACYLYFPVETLRLLGKILCWFFYKLRFQSKIDIPTKGPLLLVCNHVSFIDWLFIGSFFPRPVRFVMYYQFMNIPIIKYIFKQGGVIPIAGKNEHIDIFNAAFKSVSEALNKGEVVCIFPEGELTKNGKIGVFKTGVEHVLKNDLVPILPLALKGLWGSYFSYHNGKALKGFPKPTNRKVDLTVGLIIDKSEIEEDLKLGNLSSKLHDRVVSLFES